MFYALNMNMLYTTDAFSLRRANDLCKELIAQVHTTAF